MTAWFWGNLGQSVSEMAMCSRFSSSAALNNLQVSEHDAILKIAVMSVKSLLV